MKQFKDGQQGVNEVMRELRKLGFKFGEPTPDDVQAAELECDDGEVKVYIINQ